LPIVSLPGKLPQTFPAGRRRAGRFSTGNGRKAGHRDIVLNGGRSPYATNKYKSGEHHPSLMDIGELNKKLKFLSPFIIISAGIIFTLVPFSLEQSSIYKQIVLAIGLSTIVSGIVKLIHEFVNAGIESEEIAERTVSKAARSGPLADFVAERTYSRLKDQLQSMAPGIVELSAHREDYPVYKEIWLSEEKQEIKILGRSVIDKIHQDLNQFVKKSAAWGIKNKLVRGSKITIILLDPRSPLVRQIADGEGRLPADILRDLKKSIRICTELYKELLNVTFSPGSTRWALKIKFIDQIQYITYTDISHPDPSLDRTIIGFYLNQIGFKQPSFRVVDRKIKTYFDDYFKALESISKLKDTGGNEIPNWLVKWDEGSDRPQLNLGLYSEFYNFYLNFPEIQDDALPKPEDFAT
jgi:hypothetical protein